MDWVCCVGVPDSLKVNEKYKGFEKQIAGACAIYRHWYNLYEEGKIKELVKPDKELLCIPENEITFSLLMYTPHIEALHLTEKIYYSFFNA